MYRLLRRGSRLVLAGVLLAFGGAAFAAATPAPTLFTLSAAKPQSMMQGAQKAWPIKFSQQAAMSAVFQGGMWLPNPEGGQIYVKYQRHILHANGTWTWIGTVATAHGDQSVVLTFGKDVMFGSIPQVSGWPLQITTSAGQTEIIATDGATLTRSPAWLQVHSQPDFLVPPPPKTPQARAAAAAQRANPPPAASAAAPVTITVMVAYTPGLVTVYGSQSAAVARIQYLVDWTNQAYVNSNVYQTLDLVNTVEVNYTDTNSDAVALNDLTGVDSSGNAVTPAPALYSQVAPLREQYGADLVALVRPFDQAAAAGGECGIGWLNGQGQAAMSPAYGYSVVSDKADSSVTNGQFCLTGTFAHELGHNMGNAHDRATSSGSGTGSVNGGGAYPYSYGYINSSLGFFTIMAYGTSSESPMQVFSNPDITYCMNAPCGVADSSPQSADNAHSMNNTAPLIAQFMPGAPGPGGWNYDYFYYPRNDMTGSGISDLLWANTSTNEFGYWQMQGAQVAGIWLAAIAPGYRVVATGDFNGDGKVDVVWQGPGNDLYLWTSTGSGFSSQAIGTLPAGAQIVGAGDVCGCDPADLIYVDPSNGTVGYRAMQGGTTNQMWSTTVAPGYHIAAMGDFFGNGQTDLVWTSASNDLYMWIPNGKGNGFSSSYMGTYPAGWTLVGAGDVNGDGKDDLLWRNQGAGLFGYWLMNGASEISGASFAAGSNYNVAAIGDFNGDGKIDVIWTSAANDLYLWSSNGSAFVPSYVGTYPAGWSVISSQLMATYRHPPQ